MRNPAAARRTLLHIAMAAAMAFSAPAFAEQKKAPGDAAVAQALRKAQGMLQELSAENERLAERVKVLDEQVGRLAPRASKLDAVTSELSRQQDGAQVLREQNGALVERINRDAARTRELQEQFAASQQDNALLVQAVRERSEWIDGCTAKNAQLLQVNQELVTRYNSKGVWAALKSAEPITQIGRVQQEAETQSYAVKLEKLKITRWRDSE